MGYGLSRESTETKVAMRTVILTSADTDFRTRLKQQLTAMRWSVREAGGGAEAMAQLEAEGAEAMVLDTELPDLEVGEFANEMRQLHPVMDLLRVDAGADDTGPRSPRRNELLHALRQAQRDSYLGGVGDRSARSSAPVAPPSLSAGDRLAPRGERAIAALDVAEILRSRSQAAPTDSRRPVPTEPETSGASQQPHGLPLVDSASGSASPKQPAPPLRARVAPLPDMVGESPDMLELTRMVRLVAPRSTTVLIQGDTGTGKELVAKAVHRLSLRASKPYLVLNCAAIPEALLEAELFGHTRGAFTGAVQSRTGRIEAANGGTLFLDEIGEMPFALQAKMLRFLESGELQRVGDNETIRVDVRVVAASHQPLQQRSMEGAFRLDLYHRLAVFPVRVPPLRDRMEDVLLLAEFLLAKLGEDSPAKRLSAGAAMKLLEHDWPGNVRELAHVLERGVIFAEDRREISREDIRF
jgi:DNA-binding NtrC family response regulator